MGSLYRDSPFLVMDVNLKDFLEEKIEIKEDRHYWLVRSMSETQPKQD